MEFPGQKMIEKLNTLKSRLNNSGLERTFGLLEAMGKDCTYYRKSLDIFLTKDFADIKALISELNDIMNKL